MNSSKVIAFYFEEEKFRTVVKVDSLYMPTPKILSCEEITIDKDHNLYVLSRGQGWLPNGGIFLLPERKDMSRYSSYGVDNGLFIHERGFLYLANDFTQMLEIYDPYFNLILQEDLQKKEHHRSATYDVFCYKDKIYLGGNRQLLVFR